MAQFSDANRTIEHLIDLLKNSGGLPIDARVVEAVPDTGLGSAILVTLTGEGSGLFLRNNGELLEALQEVAAAALKLSPEQYGRLAFDVDDEPARRGAASICAQCNAA